MPVTEIIAVVVAVVAAYVAWRGLVVMNATMRMSRALRRGEAAQAAAAALAGLGRVAWNLGNGYRAARRLDLHDAAHWIVFQTDLTQRFDGLDVDARVAIASFRDQDAGRAAEEAIDKAYSAVAAYETNDPLRAPQDIANGLFADVEEAQRLATAASKKFVGLAADAARETDRYEARGRSWWRW